MSELTVLETYDGNYAERVVKAVYEAIAVNNLDPVQRTTRMQEEVLIEHSKVGD